MNKAELEEALSLSEQINEELSKKNEELKQRLETLEATLKVAANKQPTSKPKPVIPEPFEFDGKVVKFKVAAVSLGGKKYITNDEKENEDFIKKLLEIKSPVIEVVSE